MAQSKEYPISVAFLGGNDRGHSCGYCSNKTGLIQNKSLEICYFCSFTYSFDTSVMKPEVYKSLMDCGWRRCGSYFYKPDLFKSCCKSYTIRMNATQFKIKKSQKKVLKKWNKFIYSKDGINEATKIQEEIKLLNTKEEQNKNRKSFDNGKKIVDYKSLDEQQLELKERVISLAQALEISKSLIVNELNNPSIVIAQLSFIKKEILDAFKILPSRCQKKGSYFTNYFMIFFARNKEALQGTKPEQFVEKCQEILKSLFDQFIKDYQCQVDGNGQVNFFERYIVRKTSLSSIPNPMLSSSNEQSSKNVEQSDSNKIKEDVLPTQTIKSEPQIQQISISNIIQVEKEGEIIEEKQNLNTSLIKEETTRNIEFLKKGKGKKEENKMDESMQEKEDETEFKWETDKFSSSEIKKGRLTIKIQLAKADEQNFQMYSRYCQDVHEKKKESFDGFKRFLCEKTLAFNMKNSEIQKDQKLLLGCFHMNYYLDNEFIAVGVVDLFEECLSSVYFYYEPKYSEYSLGVIGALYEIDYVKQLSHFFPKYQHYYLGFYIQNCQKMVYKGDYGPAELLCPRTYKWYHLDENVRKFIDSNSKDPSLAPQQEVIDGRMSHSTNLIALQKFVEEKTRTALQGQVIPSKQFFSFFNSSLKNTFYAIASAIDQNLYPTLLFDYSQQ